MRVFEATITSQGQVTIPAEVRRKLGLSKREKVSFVIDGNRVELAPSRFTLDSIFGSVGPLSDQSLDFDREIEEAMQDRADEVVRKQSSQ